MKEDVCHECGQVVQKPHKETLTKIKCQMLKAAAAHVISTELNNFKKSDLPEQSHSEYANFQKLRYHGLIAKIKGTRDRWCITRNGWAFLRGELQLAKFVLVRNNHTLSDGRSEDHVSLLDVLKGGDYLETTFEYFDDNGNMVGLRPGGVPQQGVLL